MINNETDGIANTFICFPIKSKREFIPSCFLNRGMV